MRRSIERFGTAHFEEFETGAGGDRAELSGSVCIVGESGQWTILAERAVVLGLRPGAQLRAEVSAPTLLLEGWRIVAERLESDGESLDLEEVGFSGMGVVGSAARLAIDLQGGGSSASEVRVEGDAFRLRAASARLQEAVLDLTTVSITTCVCPGQPFYTIVGSDARLDLEIERLTVENGSLALGGVSVPLGESFELSGPALERLSPPLALEYRPEEGTGLGVVFPDLRLEDGLSLEFGILGLDSEHPLQGYALARYEDDRVSFTVGRARGGPLAEFELVEPLGPAVETVFAVRNRHRARSDYLHEGELLVRVEPEDLQLGSRVGLGWHGRLSASVSAQGVGEDIVASPRLGAAGGLRLTYRPAPRNALSLAADAQATLYPALAASQYGLALRPSWNFSRGPWRVSLEYERLWTDSGSPFGVQLDRLEPRHRLQGRAAVAAPLAGGDAHLQVDLAYDLLRLGGGPPEGLERLAAGFGVSYPAGEWSIEVQTRLELAGLLDPDPAGTRQAHLLVGFTGRSGQWEVGSRLRYELAAGQQGLSLAEASLAMPLRFDGGTVTPYLALDFAPLAVAGEPPRVSGHGLVLTWASCCGTIRVGYRQQDNSFVTSFGIALER